MVVPCGGSLHFLRFSRKLSVPARLLSRTSVQFADTVPPPNGALLDPCCNPEKPLKLTLSQITQAAYAIKNGVEQTPSRYSRHLSQKTGMKVYLKMESGQATGSFKERGARWALMNLTEEEKKAGVFAASAGNHAQALCIHGKELGIPVTVVMPRHAAIQKISSCKALGGNIHVKGKDLSESRMIALQKAKDAGGKYINGYDHIDILAGAGTIGLEIMDQVPDVDAIIVPTGGGGLLAGVVTAVKSVRKDIQVIGVQSESCPSWPVALKNGKPTFTPVQSTLADGLAVPLPGVNAFESAKDQLDEMVLVSEREIGVGILRLMELDKAVVEGAGAVGVAALLSRKLDHLQGKNVVSIITGGNIDTTQFGRCLDRALSYDNRLVRFKIVVSDRPGGVAEMCNIIKDCGASIKEMFLERAWNRKDIFTVRCKVYAETRDCDHSLQLESALKKRYGDDDCLFNLAPFEKQIREQ